MKQHIEQQQEHIEYIDVLRVLSMLSVVCLHTFSGSLRGNIGSPVWHFANIATSIMSTSVPIFFMISGALLLSSEKTTSIKLTYQRRLPKMVLPFVVWSIIAIGYFFMVKIHFAGLLDFSIIYLKLSNILAQPATVHLWFMYVLIPLYMISPILKRLVNGLETEHVKYMFLLFLLFSSILPTIAYFLPANIGNVITFNREFNLNIWNGYPGYFLAGYYIFKYERRISLKLLFSIIVIDIAIISAGTFWKTVISGKYSEVFKNYSGLFMVLLTLSVFLIVKEAMLKYNLNRNLWRIVSVLSGLSYGVYLSHNLIIDFMQNYITLWPAKSLHSLTGSYFLALSVSLILTLFLASARITAFIFTGQTFANACRTCNLQYLFSNCKTLLIKYLGGQNEKN